MGNQSFSEHLVNEVYSSMLALLALLEKRDRLLYIDAPSLRLEYMAKIGSFEETVLESELEASQLERKTELVQICVNRREPINMEAIDRQLSAERSEKLSELEAADKTAAELPSLSDAEKDELQTKYRRITESFHPQINLQVTKTQKELYEKALDAYRLQDIEAIRVIYDMLYGVGIKAAAEKANAPETKPDIPDISDLSDTFASDYTLADELYPYFSKTEADAVLNDTVRRYGEERAAAEKEIDDIQKSFPFNARDTLASEKLTEEYIAELNVRLRRSRERIESLTEKLDAMTGAEHHG